MKLLNPRNNISVILVPSGCSFLLQPLDVALNKPLKDRLRVRFGEWFKKKAHSQQIKLLHAIFDHQPQNTL